MTLNTTNTTLKTVFVKPSTKKFARSHYPLGGDQSFGKRASSGWKSAQQVNALKKRRNSLAPSIKLSDYDLNSNQEFEPMLKLSNAEINNWDEYQLNIAQVNVNTTQSISPEEEIAMLVAKFDEEPIEKGHQETLYLMDMESSDQKINSDEISRDQELDFDNAHLLHSGSNYVDNRLAQKSA